MQTMSRGVLYRFVIVNMKFVISSSLPKPYNIFFCFLFLTFVIFMLTCTQWNILKGQNLMTQFLKQSHKPNFNCWVYDTNQASLCKKTETNILGFVGHFICHNYPKPHWRVKTVVANSEKWMWQTQIKLFFTTMGIRRVLTQELGRCVVPSNTFFF